MKRASPKPGEYVTNEDIASYAAAGHKDCNGTGFVRRDLQELCNCARERFLDSNIFRIWADPNRDALRWGPNPPNADELREASRRTLGYWAQFQGLTASDKTTGDT